MNAVSLQVPPRWEILESARPKPLQFALREVEYGYRPGSSFILSILTHCLGLIVVVSLGRYAIPRPAVFVKPPLELTRVDNILVLPPLGGGTEGTGQAGGGQGSGNEVSSGLRARSRRGFAYPGPQPIISNPPNATLGMQTLLQPSVENLPQLHQLVELPNLVQPAPPPTEAVHEQPVLVVKAGTVSLSPNIEPTVAAPKVTLPVAQTNKLASVMESRPQLPRRAVPDPVAAAEIVGNVKNNGGLLVLNAVPPPPDVTGKIPKAEARSLFAVSPAEATIIADPGAGTKAGGSASSAAGNGDRSDIRSGDALAEAASGGNAAAVRTEGSGSGSGGRYGNGHGGGLDSTNNTAGTGRGNGSGSALGTGASVGIGTGSGAGSAPGTGGFPGITIQGGRYGNSGNMLAKPDARRQTSYSLTIVSTAGSGGLPDFGVFHNEKVYTVYLDMRSSADDHVTPSWTMQYAVLQPEAAPGEAPVRIRGTPTPPYAMLKEVPQFAPELLHGYARPLIVASAILDTAGKLEEVSIRQASENQLIQPLVEALKNWVFEPATIAGQPVALKVLLGIRLPATR